MLTKVIKVTDQNGLHLRPATNLCKAAVKYDCSITFSRGDSHADAKSVLSLLAAMVKQGDSITITCDGVDEESAMEEISALIDRDMDVPKGN